MNETVTNNMNQEGCMDASESNNEKSVKEVLKKDYIIPAYQRGYRWDEKQVKELISDLFTYYEEEENAKWPKTSFYCMQALIIKNKNVVDGQQRLTTMYILVSYLLGNKLLAPADISLGSIEYESRKGTNEFLSGIKAYQEKKYDVNSMETRDTTCIANAYNIISVERKEFNKKCKDKKEFEDKYKDYKWLIKLIKDDKIKFIVSDYSKEEIEEIDIFKALNTGKIELTDAELVRAKLLINIDDDSKRDTVAKEWDEIEHRLQDNSFWYFLQNDNDDTGSRIDYLFLLQAKRIEKEAEEKGIKKILNKNDEHYLYRFLNRYRLDEKKGFDEKNNFENVETTELFWDRIKEDYEILNKWYEDVEIYNYIGQITYSGTVDTIVDLISNYYGKSRYEFIEKLKGIINKSFGEKQDYIWPEDIKTNPIVKGDEEPRIFSALWYSGRDEKKEKQDNQNQGKKIKMPKEERSKVINFLLWSNCEYLNTQLRNAKFEEMKHKANKASDERLKQKGVMAYSWEGDQKNYRFLFENLKTNKPDIEHITSYLDSEESEKFYEKKSELDQWCRNILEFCSDNDIDKIIKKFNEWKEDGKWDSVPDATLEEVKNKLDKKERDKEKWELFDKEDMKLYRDFVEYILEEYDYFKTDISIMNDISEEDKGKFKFLLETVIDRRKIGNLALLDQNINRGYRNFPFRIKRRDVIEKGLNGIYVYPCTKMVFLKEFDSMSSDLLSWNKSDFKKYRKFLAKLYYDCFFINQREYDLNIREALEKDKKVGLKDIEKVYKTKMLYEG